MRKLIVFSLSVLVLSGIKGADTRPFLEQNGLVVMEVESSPLAGDWKLENSVTPYLGTCYYTWRRGGATSITSAGQGVLSYKVKISKPGTYNFRFRSYHNYPADQTQQNDTWVRMDSGNWVKCYQVNSASGSWNFKCTFEIGHDHVAPAYQLTAGTHTLQLSGRSYGHSVDRIHLYTDDVLNPEYPFYPESPREGDTGLRLVKNNAALHTIPGVCGIAYDITGRKVYDTGRKGCYIFVAPDQGNNNIISHVKYK